MCVNIHLFLWFIPTLSTSSSDSRRGILWRGETCRGCDSHLGGESGLQGESCLEGESRLWGESGLRGESCLGGVSDLRNESCLGGESGWGDEWSWTEGELLYFGTPSLSTS